MLTLTSILTQPRNCWHIAQATRVAFLVDAAAYYEAFAIAVEQAEHSICILAWDINGRIRLRRERPEETLRHLFHRQLQATPALNIYILNWEFPLVYSPERELLPTFDKAWQLHPRLHYRWDNHHPIGASHHQKVVVIDDRLAFVGGLDLTDERWDMPCHLGNDRRRRGFRVDCYKPFHDTTMLVEGPVAAQLGRLARDRWQRAGQVNGTVEGSTAWPPAPASATDLWPPSVEPDMQATDVAIARTKPFYKGHAAVREVEQLFVDAICSARRYLYIENQYFTSRVATAAIRERLREPEGPEIIVLLPHGTNGWLEAASLGVLRARMIQELKSVDVHHRLHVYYPTIENLNDGAYIKVHAKVLIADDRFLKIGSANLCNRSMGMDTECDLAIEMPEPDKRIARFRNNLLAEHMGIPLTRVETLIAQFGSLAKTIEQGSQPGRRLVPFSGEVSRVWNLFIPKAILLDPDHPLEAERHISQQLARQGKRWEALARLARIAPFWLVNFIGFPILGFWMVRRHLAHVLFRRS